jgi:hypothetical protein
MVARGEAVEYAIFRTGLKEAVRDCRGTFTPYYGPDWWRRP